MTFEEWWKDYTRGWADPSKCELPAKAAYYKGMDAVNSFLSGKVERLELEIEQLRKDIK